MIPQGTDVQGVSRQFNELFYNDFEHTWETTHWLGTKVLKCPMDLWVYQELIYRLNPDLIIETGTAHGGSAHYLASMLDLIGNGRVITIDIVGTEQFPHRPAHPRIEYIQGSSTSPGVYSKVKKEAAQGTVMVILDSDHRMQHVYSELDLYGVLVTQGSYLIVEDTNVNGNPVCPEHGPGPMEALGAWLPDHTADFEQDAFCERFHLTFNPRGYLRRL